MGPSRLKLRILALVTVALSGSLPCVAQPAPSADGALAARIERVLTLHPIIDGHNDLPWEIRERFQGDLGKIDLRADTSKMPRNEDQVPFMTDIPRLRAGHVGGQFWSVYIPASVTGPLAVKMTLEQIDLVTSMAQIYPNDFVLATSADEVERAFKAGKIASLIGIEGGHQIDNSLPALRQMFRLGARYMTLTHTSNTDWADSATDNPTHHGLTPFGVTIVHEMNRLGMLVDISHVAPETMKAALAASAAPVMFSHSSARALVDHPRDVPDDVLVLIKQNRGVVMVNFYPGYVSQAKAQWDADRAAEASRFNAAPYSGLYIGQPERAKAAMAAWEKAHPKPEVTLSMVADHFDHIRKIAGIDAVGIGSDFDGIPEGPTGLGSVDKFPALMTELARRGWSDEEIVKAASGNILRLMREVEAVAKKLQATELPSMAVLPATR